MPRASLSLCGQALIYKDSTDGLSLPGFNTPAEAVLFAEGVYLGSVMVASSVAGV